MTLTAQKENSLQGPLSESTVNRRTARPQGRLIRVMVHTALLPFLCILWNANNVHSAPTMTIPVGEAVYQLHCLRCHGPSGDGKGPDATALIVPPRDFHSPESTAKTDYELRTIIIWGIVFSPMHGWWDRLSVDEIRAVIGYIRQLAPYQPRI